MGVEDVNLGEKGRLLSSWRRHVRTFAHPTHVFPEWILFNPSLFHDQPPATLESCHSSIISMICCMDVKYYIFLDKNEMDSEEF